MYAVFYDDQFADWWVNDNLSWIPDTIAGHSWDSKKVMVYKYDYKLTPSVVWEFSESRQLKIMQTAMVPVGDKWEVQVVGLDQTLEPQVVYNGQA